MGISTLAQNLTCIVVLRETVWGNMSVMTMGAFHVFTEIATPSGLLLHGKRDLSNNIRFAVLLDK